MPGAALMVVSLVCGCASNTIDEAVPVTAVTQALPAPVQPVQEGVSTAVAIEPVPVTAPLTQAPKNSGQYPNINVVPSGEIVQLSDAETAATRANLEHEAQVQQQRGESPADYLARLRKLQKLGSTHAAATLRQIEKSQ